MKGNAKLMTVTTKTEPATASPSWPISAKYDAIKVEATKAKFNDTSMLLLLLLWLFLLAFLCLACCC